MKKSQWFILFTTCFLAGCTTPLKNQKDLYEQAYLPDGLTSLWYAGSDTNQHVFYRREFLHRTKRYLLPRNQLEIKKEFPVTRDPEKWLSLNYQTNHFVLYGIRETNGWGPIESLGSEMHDITEPQPSGARDVVPAAQDP